MTASLQPKSIVAYLPAAAAAEQILDLALPLVGRFQAHLTGLPRVSYRKSAGVNTYRFLRPRE
ncbi:MAG TPA: hypothetical protein VHG92_06525 [Afifellaceae bacterium]|nr:hypothetical protein [Afifellaceae bacterium]